MRISSYRAALFFALFHTLCKNRPHVFGIFLPRAERFDTTFEKEYNHRDMKTTRLEKTKRICLVALMLAITIIFCFVPVQIGTITLALMILPTLVVAQVCDFKTTFAVAAFMGVINYIAWFTTKAASPVAPIFQNPLVCILPRILIGVVSYLVRYGLQRAIFFNRPLRKYKDEYVRETSYQEDFDAEKSDIALVGEDVAINQTAANSVENTQIHEHSDKQSKHSSNKSRALKDGAINQAIYTLSAALGVVTNTVFVAIFTLIFFNGTYIAQNTIVTVEYVLAWFSLNFLVEILVFSFLTPPIVLAIKAARLA